MAKVMRLSQSGTVKGTIIEMRGMTLKVKAATADTVYEVASQCIDWATECFEEADRLTKLRQAAWDVAQEAIEKNWFDAADGEELWDKITNLGDMWESRAAELKAKGDAYDDAWAYLSSILEEQDQGSMTPKVETE